MEGWYRIPGSHPTRERTLRAWTLHLSVSATSHHLRRLYDLGLVETRREGKLVHYSLSHPWPAAVVEQVLQEAVSL